MGNIVEFSHQANHVTRWSAPQLESKHERLLESYTSLSSAPVVGPKTAASLQAFLDADIDPPMPTRKDVTAMVGLLANVKRMRDSTDEEAAGRMDQYWQGLKDIPLDDLRHAYDVLLKGSPWFPDISEIRKAADGGPVKRHRIRRAVAESLIRKHESEWEPPHEPLTPEQLAQVKALTAGLINEGEAA
jgi:hypothetical protein